MLENALTTYSPLDLINNILLNNMKTISELFNTQKIQLPSVLNTTNMMKTAIAYLEPKMEKKEGTQKDTIVLTTIKNDIHNIGKNLVDIILTTRPDQQHIT